MRGFLLSLIAAIALPLNQTSFADGPPRFVLIGTSDATGISADGKSVTGRYFTPYVWRESTGLQSIHLPADFELYSVNDISGDGTTIVGGGTLGIGANRQYESFRWRQDTGFQLLGTLPANHTYPSYGNNVSFDGSVVVGTTDSLNGRRAFRWTQGTGLVNMGTLGAGSGYPFSEANGVSADGKTTVGFVTTTDDAYYKAFRWTDPNGYDVIGLPPVDHPLGIPAGGATAISGDGSVVAGMSQLNGLDSWTWTADAGFSLLRMETPENTGNVYNISYDGSVVVGRQITWGQPTPAQVIYDAVIWQKTASGYQIHRVADLLSAAGVSTAGLHLEDTTDVAADGRTIIGTGLDATGHRQAWYAVLPQFVPEPSSLLLSIVAMATYFASNRALWRRR